MSKLIGTNPNQVPSNADLGTAAFMDKKDFLLSKGSSLSAIDTVIPNTAVDVFIYDTSKDSDGGAWRKRTQHTSWYNERLNTPIRGSRREFPAVAVIVCTANDVFIYDGDDPSLPMWIKFTEDRVAPKGFPNGNTGSSLVAVTAIDGNIFIASGVGSSNIGGGLNMASFVEDTGYTWFNYSTYINYSRFDGNISQRYDGLNSTRINGNTIISNYINDIDVTVLDGSPINPATGLPVPTIAVGTNLGVSIIKDNGTVVDITLPSTYSVVYNVKFVDKDKIAFVVDSTTAKRAVRVHDIPTSDVSISSQLQKQSSLEFYADAAYTTTGPDINITPSAATHISDIESGSYGERNISVESSNYAQWNGLYKIDANSGNVSNSLQARVASNFNTGWMPGDIKLATLSDTDATDITGAELVTNGTFDSNISGWTNYATARATISWDAGTIKVDNTTGTGDGYVYQTGISLTVGSVVTITMTFTNTTLDAKIYFVNGSSPIGGAKVVALVNGVATCTLAVPTGADGILIGNQDMLTAWNLDNVSVRLAVPDRSINDNGLQVFGNVKKTPVASGADLVAYSGFTSGNYSGVRLEQPYNADINPVSGDYSIAFWVKDVGTGTDVMGLGKRGTDLAWNIYHDAAGGLRFTVSYDGTGYQSIVEIQFEGTIDKWSHVVYTKVGNVYSAYLNGNLYISNTGTSDTLYATSRPFMIGSGQTNNNIVGDPKYALLKISKTAPSAEQIKKMYEDEKVLFQENAKATLYGTSDVVKALAYDEDANLLHAGTSAGRSVFQGLRRVDNTTRAVGTAISAVDGFVVEE